MGLGWHSGSSNATADTAFLETLQSIVTELNGLKLAVNEIAGTLLPPDCAVQSASGAYVVSDTGAYVVHECLATEGSLVIDEAGAYLSTEMGEFVAYDSIETTDLLLMNELGAYVVNEYDTYIAYESVEAA